MDHNNYYPPPDGQYSMPHPQGAPAFPNADARIGFPDANPYQNQYQSHQGQGYAPAYLPEPFAGANAPSSYPPPHGPPPGPPGGYGTPMSHQPNSYGPPIPPMGASHPNQPQQPYGAQPQLGQYGQPSMMYLGVSIADPFNHSSSYQQGYDPTHDCDTVIRAVKGFGTDENLLINALVPLTPLQMASVSDMYQQKTRKTLPDTIQSETSGYFRDGLRALVLGPLRYDAELLYQSLSGIGTTETLLTEIIMGRSSREIELLKQEFRRLYKRDLVQMVEGDLSGKTKTMFTMALNLNPNLDTYTHVDHQEVVKDAQALRQAGQGRLGTDEMAFCNILINRSKPHITALIDYYDKNYKKLSKLVKSELSGHMRDALLHIIKGLKPKRIGLGEGVWRDAKLLEHSMAGFGTKDRLLVARLVRAHWDKRRFDAIKTAYQTRYKTRLESRVAGEVSGDYKRLMVRIVNN